MIIGLGTDLVDNRRVERLLLSRGDRFARRVFTDRERDYCAAKLTPHINFAARFAAKEAFLKAVGHTAGIRWREIEVRHDNDGRPCLAADGTAADRLRELGVTTVHLSLTHERNYAQAFVVLEGAS